MHKSFFTFRRTMILPICWIAGLFLGILCASDADPAVVSLMRLSASRQVSIVLVLTFSALPFLFAAFAVLIQHTAIVCAIIFLRCFGFGFCLWLTCIAFGSAAWLIGPMLLFSDWASLILLCGFILRCSSGPTRRIKGELMLCLFLAAVFAVIDHISVSPYLAMLINS